MGIGVVEAAKVTPEAATEVVETAEEEVAEVVVFIEEDEMMELTAVEAAVAT